MNILLERKQKIYFSQKTKVFWKQRYFQLFALIGITLLIVFSYIPMIGLIIAFKDYDIITGFTGMFTSEWVGLDYFIELFTDYNFPLIMRNTLAISILKLIFTFPIPIIFAIMLSEVRHLGIKKIIQSASYLPYFISWVIVAGFAVQFLNTQYGVINELLQFFGFVSEPISFLSSPDYYWPIAVITGVWKEMGWWAIIILAAIVGISPAIYEAATIDGAGRMQKIIYVTLPGIAPTITVIFILALGNLIGGGLGGSTFEQSYLLGNAGNHEASDVIQTYAFRVGLSAGRYAYATAVGLFQSIISLILVFGSNFVSKKIAGSGLF